MTSTESMNLVQAILKRRSIRTFSKAELNQRHISHLLWAAQGAGDESGKRNAPSAGAQFPLTLYLAAGNVAATPAGLYKYDVEQHSLLHLSSGDLRESLEAAAIDVQPWIAQCAAVVIVTADMTEMRDHFSDQPPAGERGDRYAYMETGSVAQNIYLQGAALGLAVVLVGGFDDEKIKLAMGDSELHQITALICIGNCRSREKK